MKSHYLIKSISLALITIYSAGVLASEVWSGVATIPHPVGGKDFSMCSIPLDSYI